MIGSPKATDAGCPIFATVLWSLRWAFVRSANRLLSSRDDRPSSPILRLLRILPLVAILFALAVPTHPPAQNPLVLNLTVHDTIQPVTEQYIARGLLDAK